MLAKNSELPKIWGSAALLAAPPPPGRYAYEDVGSLLKIKITRLSRCKLGGAVVRVLASTNEVRVQIPVSKPYVG